MIAVACTMGVTCAASTFFAVPAATTSTLSYDVAPGFMIRTSLATG